MYSKQDTKTFISKVSQNLIIDEKTINTSEFIENHIFKQAILLDPSLSQLDFTIDDKSQFMIDKQGYCVVSYKTLYGHKNHENIAYAYNQHYTDIDAHVVHVMGVFDSLHDKTKGYFYAVRLKADVLLEQAFVPNSQKPELIDSCEDTLRKKSALRIIKGEYPSYRTRVENHESNNPNLQNSSKGSGKISPHSDQNRFFQPNESDKLLNENKISNQMHTFDQSILQQLNPELDLKAQKNQYINLLTEQINANSPEFKKSFALYLLNNPAHLLKKERHFFRWANYSNQTLSMHQALAMLLQGADKPVISGDNSLKIEEHELSRHVEQFFRNK